jgi:predicted nuclease of restriction endonuclease-like RecB superfamily
MKTPSHDIAVAAPAPAHRDNLDNLDNLDDSMFEARVADIDNVDDSMCETRVADVDDDLDSVPPPAQRARARLVDAAGLGDSTDATSTLAGPQSAARRPPREPPLPDLSVLDEDDIGWIARLIDIAVACQGQPWRVALERIDGAQYLDQPVPHHHFVAVVGALQRVLGGRSHKAQLARACRELVLGHPALSSATRADRLAAAARALGLSCEDVERLLWSDLPRERPVELPVGRPSELEVAAFANLQLIQRAVRRASSITIAARGDAGALIRGASTRGLLATVSVARDDDEVTVLDIVGPLTLCHRTGVYGRAIASLVPFLAECSAFELTALASGMAGAYRTRLASPVLLPRLPANATTSSSTTTRLARDLRRAVPGVEIVVGPPPILVGDTLVCPDIALDRGRLYVEIVGFWTAAHLERKRAAYARAGLEVLLCVDQERGCADADELLPANVIAYVRHVDVVAITGRLPMRGGDGAAYDLRARSR